MSPRYGSVPMHASGDGGAIEGVQYEGKKPKPAPQQTAKVTPKNTQHVVNNAIAANPQQYPNPRYYGNPKPNTNTNNKYYEGPQNNNNSSAKSYGTMKFDDGSKLPPGAKVVSDTVTE